MEKECEEKKVLEQEAAEEIRDVQVECVNGGHGEVLKEDTKDMVGLDLFVRVRKERLKEDTKDMVGLDLTSGVHWDP